MRPVTVQPASILAREPHQKLRFNLQELSGSLGDLGTFLPLTAAVSITCGMDFGLILVFAGILHVLSGLAFRQPVPVQPMKAIAAVAITEGLLPGQIAAAGMLMGGLMVALALSGAVDAVVRYVPRAVVRGIQAGIGAKLAFTGAQWVWDLPVTGWDSAVVALAAGAALLWPWTGRAPVLLLVFLGGFALLLIEQPGLAEEVGFQPPHPMLVWPYPRDWWVGFTAGAVPQLPLTLLNSVVAVCALSEDLYPGRGLQPRRVAASVGLMNVLTVPLGGLPLCHGAGGLAGQYRFGARSGGSVVMLGAVKVVAGLLFGAALLPLLQAYPRSILAVMLVFAGLTLARPARDSLRGWPLAVVVFTVAGILAFDTAIGTLAGCAAAALGRWRMRGRS